jgi:hypothetical protein
MRRHARDFLNSVWGTAGVGVGAALAMTGAPALEWWIFAGWLAASLYVWTRMERGG